MNINSTMGLKLQWPWWWPKVKLTLRRNISVLGAVDVVFALTKQDETINSV